MAINKNKFFKYGVRVILTVINLLILMYRPSLQFSEYNTSFLTIISSLIFMFFIGYILYHFYQGNYRDAGLDIIFLIMNFILPVIIFFIVFSFQS